MKKFNFNLKRRKIIRRRRHCIRRYTRANSRLNSFRERKIRQLANTKRRRIGVEKRLRKYCRFTNNVCIQKRMTKLNLKWKKVDTKRETKRNKVIAKLTQRISFLEKTCDNLHKLAQPFIKKRSFLKNLQFKDIKDCTKSHILILFMRNQVKYRIKKKKNLATCIANVKLRITKVKPIYDAKKK